jgi:hypothetical protein
MSEQLPKAARNEIRKLKATYFNNIAVGFGLVGVVTPYFTFTYNLAGRSLEDFASHDIETAVVVGLGSAVLSYQIHKHAKKILSTLED